MKIVNSVKRIKIFEVIIILAFNICGSVAANEVKSLSEKRTLAEKTIKSWEAQLESQKKNNDASLVYGLNIYQNTIYMVSRSLIENFYCEDKSKLKINELTYYFKIRDMKKEILKYVADFSKDSMDWSFSTYQNGEFSKNIINNSGIDLFDKTINIKLTFKKSKVCPIDGEKIYIVDRQSLELLAVLTKIHFDEGTYIGLTYSRNLSTDELSTLNKKSHFDSGSKNVKSPEEIKAFILQLDNETPRLLEDCPWLLEKKITPDL